MDLDDADCTRIVAHWYKDHNDGLGPSGADFVYSYFHPSERGLWYSTWNEIHTQEKWH